MSYYCRMYRVTGKECDLEHLFIPGEVGHFMKTILC